MWGAMDGWGPGMGWFMLSHALWWVLIIVGLVWLVMWVSGRGPAGRGRTASEDRALTVLRERYARGEIDEAEFEERKRVLGR